MRDALDDLDELDKCINISDMNEDELFELLDKIDYTEMVSENSEIICTTCNSSDNIAEDKAQGINVCMGCGTIISEIIDEGGEWRQYEDGKEGYLRCNTITNPFLPQSSLGTMISGSNHNRVKMLHTWNAMPYKERSLNIVLKEIQNKCREAGILKCVEDDAKILYKNISESTYLFGKNKGKPVIIRGNNRKSLTAACVFFACKRKGKTRSPKEIAKLFGLKYKYITKGCKIFRKLIRFKYTQDYMKISNPEHFITRFCRILHITNNYIDNALQIARNIQKLNLASTHTPFSIAVSSILLIIEMNTLNIDRKLMSKEFGISIVTINKTYKKISQYMNILVDDELVDKLVVALAEERKQVVMPASFKELYDNIIDEENGNIKSDIKRFDIRFDVENDIDEYVDNINLELYNTLSFTDEIYKKVVSETK